LRQVKEHGILEPLLVRPLKDGEYELVAGERRLRAAREVGLEAVPIVVRELDDRQAIQVALIENLQREDLNPVEETDAVLGFAGDLFGDNEGGCDFVVLSGASGKTSRSGIGTKRFVPIGNCSKCHGRSGSV
jgi:hypothetical protein